MGCTASKVSSPVASTAVNSSGKVHATVSCGEAATSAVNGSEKAHAIISAGKVKFLDVAWLMARPSDWRITRCQDLPEEAFLPSEIAGDLFVKSEICGLAALSYRWYSPAHPDPDGSQFAKLHAFLELMKRPPRGLFWDFGSLPQKDRSAEEQTIFDCGLQAVNYIYGSSSVYVLQLKEVPQELGIGTYASSGWCTFEEVCACLNKDTIGLLNITSAAIKDGCRFEDYQGRYPALWQPIEQQVSIGRRAPMHPDDMASLLLDANKVRFTSGADAQRVAVLYERFFKDVVSRVVEINIDVLCRLGDGFDEDEALLFARALPEYKNVHTISLNGHPLSLKITTLMVDTLVGMPNVSVFKNLDGDWDLPYLASRLPELPNLRRLTVGDESHGDMKAFRQAWASAGKDPKNFGVGRWE